MRFKFICLTLLFASIVAIACSSSDPPPPVADSGVVNDANMIPCGARRVLQKVCQECHARPLKQAAPFPIVTRSDVFATYQGNVVRSLIVEQLNARRMPVEPVTMDDTQRQVLLDWVNAGAYAVAAQACDDNPAPNDASTKADVDADDASGDAADVDANLDAGADVDGG